MINLIAPVLIVEDDSFMQQRLRLILLDIGYADKDLHFMGSIAEVERLVDYRQVALALIDLGLPDGNGIVLIEKLSQLRAEIPVLVISAWSTENMIINALQAGATGYILKERDDIELKVSIRSVLKGGAPIDPFIARHILNKIPLQTDTPAEAVTGTAGQELHAVNLTQREHQILNLVASGLSNQEIANHIFLSRHTVETHIRSVYRKLAVTNRTKAISRAREIGLL
ncbi:response regulator transcription factor [Advenella alkanexedens]|uniref:response regulator transcription factor n=1 Tax=Advenella alkanexedens TaxID=1481665 RepID=UPI002674AA01|nr:response regulator transcription factor [Advenella alkanexedens]WKU19041.1 response regulator transcription factor [Advenella alkanexedens]